MVIEQIHLDMLDQYSVSLRKQKHVEVEGALYPIGEPWRRAYVNSPSGRIAVENEVPEPYKTAIFAMWGNTPTVREPVTSMLVEADPAEKD